MASGADYRVDLSIYNGPLDLLLHLIREREVDIHDIPIADITEQFLLHLDVVKRIDVERAGDFLLMAATLMLIKSRTLLPRAEEENDDLDGELDPRTDLVAQLLEYKAFRDRSRALEESGSERLLRYDGRISMPDPEAPDAGKLLEDVGVHDLLLAFEKLMRETLAEVDFKVFGESLPVREVRATLRERLSIAGGSLVFRDFFVERRDRFYIVSVFCALLEMLKGGDVRLEPGHHATELRVHLVEGEDREADQAPDSQLPGAPLPGGPRFGEAPGNRLSE